jgi:hypothetical protein
LYFGDRVAVLNVRFFRTEGVFAEVLGSKAFHALIIVVGAPLKENAHAIA